MTESETQALAEFRFLIRRFIATSEHLARQHGVTPQHHQALLALAGCPRGSKPTISYLAERLLVEHHSAVGLVDRLVDHGLVERELWPLDRRQVHVHLTRRGIAVLRELAIGHRQELRSLAPQLVDALRTVVPDCRGHVWPRPDTNALPFATTAVAPHDLQEE